VFFGGGVQVEPFCLRTAREKLGIMQPGEYEIHHKKMLRSWKY